MVIRLRKPGVTFEKLPFDENYTGLIPEGRQGALLSLPYLANLRTDLHVLIFGGKDDSVNTQYSDLNLLKINLGATTDDIKTTSWSRLVSEGFFTSCIEAKALTAFTKSEKLIFWEGDNTDVLNSLRVVWPVPKDFKSYEDTQLKHYRIQ